MKCRYCQAECESDETYHRDDKHGKPVEGDLQALCNSCQAEYVQDCKAKLVSIYQRSLGDREVRVIEAASRLNDGLEMLDAEQTGESA